MATKCCVAIVNYRELLSITNHVSMESKRGITESINECLIQQ